MNREVSRLPDGTAEWVLSGGQGAVNLLSFPEKGKDFRPLRCIGAHGRTKRENAVRGSCDLLPAGSCWAVFTDGPAIEALWKACGCGRQEEVIWDCLSRWYESWFGGDGTAAEG